MAVDKKISQLTSLAQVDVSASTDVLPIVDTSATETKKITVSALVGAGATAGISGAVLTNGTINSTTIGATTPSTGAFTTLSASGNFTLSGGTANGVLYLNGSKVATSGSALVFDGTNLGIGTTSPNLKTAIFGTNNTTNSGANIYNYNIFGLEIRNQSTTNDTMAGVYFENGDGQAASAIFGLRESATLGALCFATGGSGRSNTVPERMRIDSAGNLGLGVTPSAWSGYKALQLGGGSLASFSSNAFIELLQNAFWDGSNYKYVNTGFASEYLQNSGKHVWRTVASGTAGNTITFTDAMTLDASGNLGIGTSTASFRVTNNFDAPAAWGNNANNFIEMWQNQGTNALGVAMGDDSLVSLTTNNGYSLLFATSGTERMRIDSSTGNVGIGTASPGAKLNVDGGAGNAKVKLSNTASGNTNTDGFDLDFTGANIYLTNRENGFMAFENNGAERMRIDSSGNVGIGGTADAFAKVHVKGTLVTASTISIGYYMSGTSPSSTTNTTYAFATNLFTQAASYTLSNYTHYFAYQNSIGAGSSITNQHGYYVDGSLTGATNNYGFYSAIASGSNRWNFYAAGTAQNYFAGKVLVGETATASYFDGAVNSSGGAAPGVCAKNTASGTFTITAWNTATSGDNSFISFATEASPTARGSITYNRGGAVVAYNTTSDYRAKDVFGAWNDAGETIDALKVYRGKMHGATLERPMMIAHEAQAVVPYAVGGEKDAVDKDGKPVYQTMDHQILVPLLIAELQAVRARLAALEAK